MQSNPSDEGSILQVSTAIAALIFGFVITIGSNRVSIAVLWLIRFTGWVSLAAAIDALVEMFTNKNLARRTYILMLLTLVALTIAYALSVANPSTLEALSSAIKQMPPTDTLP